MKDKVSYAVAAKRVGQKRSEKQQEWENTWAGKKKLVTFIAGVINATAEIKSKTERIQILVKAAIHIWI